MLILFVVVLPNGEVESIAAAIQSFFYGPSKGRVFSILQALGATGGDFAGW